ncbi:uncharacterized hydrophobic domain-containing protein [Halopelagius inordinatus]|uniref:Uncharacterized hydrophobic domain-containing protein n=1 Tax=Halopelagius inordinatus TaxID=553467 RepID=A0A1I2UKN1_9EURY|nr:DUF389 domain-containing protein [Halopelagius inordinatus]SFG77613.1 uncharacterized hydrophobic domain-containing protein [Halopelagius inordinatus]
MRLIRVRVDDDARDAVIGALDGLEATYAVLPDGERVDSAFVEVPVADGAVDPVLAHLHDSGLDRDAYTVVVDADRSEPVNENLTERFVEGPVGDRGISHPEIRERADDLRPERVTYLAFAMLSATLATAGLLLNSAIVIVGAMVIAPFAGSALSASVGAVIDDRGMLIRSVVSQTLGLAVAYASAVFVSYAVRETFFVSAALAVSRVEQVGFFITPTLLALAIAIAAGAAGALALASDLPVSIAGVAVAAAIVPSVAAAAIGTVWSRPILVLGAVVLLFMNIVFINISAYVALVAMGYRSSVVADTWNDLGPSLRIGAYALVVVVFVAVTAATAAATYSHIAFEQDVNAGVQTTLSEDDYGNLELVGVRTQYDDAGLIGSTESVTVTVVSDADRAYPELADDVRERVQERAGRGVTVEVRVLDYRRSTAPESVETDLVDRWLSTASQWVSDLFGAAADSVAGRVAR